MILDQTMSGANWTSQDTRNLRRLLMKAQEQGAELAAEVEDPSLATSWDFLEAETPQAGYSAGAMTDAVERRHEAIAPSSSVELQLPITGKPVPTEAARAMPVAPYVPEVSATTLPQAPVPEIDLTTWGNTLIDFGKFKGANRSYAELAIH